METISDRRRRKLVALVSEKGGVDRVAADTKLSAPALEQVIKGTLLPAKADGTRSRKSLGDKAARTIEERYALGRGWFDADDLTVGLPIRQIGDYFDPQLMDKYVEIIASRIAASDEITRASIAHLFSLLAEKPGLAANITQALNKLLTGDSQSPGAGQYQPQAVHPKSFVFGLPKGDLAPDDKRNRIPEKGSRKK